MRAFSHFIHALSLSFISNCPHILFSDKLNLSHSLIFYSNLYFSIQISNFLFKFDQFAGKILRSVPPLNWNVAVKRNYQELSVPNIKSAKKRVVVAEKARQHNVAARSKMRTLVKNVAKIVATGDKEAAKVAFVKAESILDRSAGKGLIHKNKAARAKSKLSALVKAMA